MGGEERGGGRVGDGGGVAKPHILNAEGPAAAIAGRARQPSQEAPCSTTPSSLYMYTEYTYMYIYVHLHVHTCIYIYV